LQDAREATETQRRRTATMSQPKHDVAVRERPCMHRTARQCNGLQRAARSPSDASCAEISPRYITYHDSPLPVALHQKGANVSRFLTLQNLRARFCATALSEIRCRLDRAFVPLGSTCPVALRPRRSRLPCEHSGAGLGFTVNTQKGELVLTSHSGNRLLGIHFKPLPYSANHPSARMQDRWADLHILISLGTPTSMMSRPFCSSALLGILFLRINSALCVMYGSFIIEATATTCSPLV
jgi:hypothetical protein